MRARTVCAGALLGVLASAAHAEVTGSYEGQMTGKKIVAPVAGVAALKQVGKALTGTVALGGDPAGGAGEYTVNGKATPKKVKLKGSNTAGATLKRAGKIGGETIQGKARVKGPGTKLAGTLALARNPPVADGSSCDAVYQANTTFFTDEVLATALLPCTACHVPSGQAEATRFRVNLADPLATARAVVPFVDAASPSTSRVLLKPLNLVPHGGGEQITPGSTEEQILMQWVDLIAQAQCN